MATDYSKFKEVKIEYQDGVLILTMMRPWTYTLIAELKEIWGMIPDDNDVRAVLMAGSGSDFSLPIGNAPLHPPVKQAHPLHGLELAGEAVHEGSSYHMSALQRLLDIPQPVVAAVHGRCTGLTANLMLFCDVIIAADNLKFGDPHITSALVPGDGATIIWPMLVGINRAKEYLLTGDLMTAAEAERIGLINRVVPAAAWGGTRRSPAARAPRCPGREPGGRPRRAATDPCRRRAPWGVRRSRRRRRGTAGSAPPCRGACFWPRRKPPG